MKLNMKIKLNMKRNDCSWKEADIKNIREIEKGIAWEDVRGCIYEQTLAVVRFD